MQKDCLLPLHISGHIREVKEEEESIPAPPFSPINEVDAGEMFSNGISESEASDIELDGDESPPELSANEIQAENSPSGWLYNRASGLMKTNWTFPVAHF